MKFLILSLLTLLSIGLYAATKTTLKLVDVSHLEAIKGLQNGDGSNFIKEASKCAPFAPGISCLRLYSNHQFVIAELCSNAGSLKPGLFIKTNGEMKHFDWYDPKYADWACKETCNDPTKCKFTIDELKENQISKITFEYEINLQGGTYQLAIEKQKIKILAKKDIDLGP